MINRDTNISVAFSTPKYTLKIQKAPGATNADTVTATWSGGNATDAQLATGIAITNGTSVTLTAHSAKPNIIWNNGTTSTTTFALTMSKDSTVTVGFYASAYALALSANEGYTLQAYTNATLTNPVADLTQVPFGATVYIRVPKTNIDNKNATVTGADNFADTTAMVKMNGDKNINATYALDTANFTFTVSNGNATITNYNKNVNYKTIELPASYQGNPVTTIANPIVTSSVFNNVSTLKTVILPNTITTIGASAFFYCDALDSINLDNVTTIGASAFSVCTALKRLILPATLTSLGSTVFANCSNLSTIWLLSTTPPYFPSDPVTVAPDPPFVDNKPSSLTLYLPNRSKAAYSAATSGGPTPGNWSDPASVGVANMQIVWY